MLRAEIGKFGVYAAVRRGHTCGAHSTGHSLRPHDPLATRTRVPQQWWPRWRASARPCTVQSQIEQVAGVNSDPSVLYSAKPNDVCAAHRSHLSNVDIGLHNQERITGVRTGCFRVVEEFANFRKGGLTESSSPRPFTTIRDISNTPNRSHTRSTRS